MSEPTSEPTISTNPSESGNANLIYILYLVGLAAGITAIIGVVMAYMAKNDAPDWLKSHYHNQINIFWKAIVLSIVGALLAVVLIGFLILIYALIWYIVRVVKGLQAVGRREAIAAPSSWGF
ncbi:MAG: DUF4870 domain-containing protein [Pseudomonadota bacterium]